MTYDPFAVDPLARVSRLSEFRKFVTSWQASITYCLDFSVLFTAAFPWASNTALRVVSAHMVDEWLRLRCDIALPPGAVLEADHFINKHEDQISAPIESYSPESDEDSFAEIFRDQFYEDQWRIRPRMPWRSTEADDIEHEGGGIDRLRRYLSECHTVSQYTQRPRTEPWELGERFARELKEYRDQRWPNAIDGFNLGLCDSLNRERLRARKSLFVLMTNTPALLRARDDGRLASLYTKADGKPYSCPLVLDPFDIVLSMWMEQVQPGWERMHPVDVMGRRRVAEIYDLGRASESDFASTVAAARKEKNRLTVEQQRQIWRSLRQLRKPLVTFLIDSQPFLHCSALGCTRRSLHVRDVTTDEDSVEHRTKYELGIHVGVESKFEPVVELLTYDGRYFAMRAPCRALPAEFAAELEVLLTNLAQADGARPPKDLGVYIMFDERKDLILKEREAGQSKRNTMLPRKTRLKTLPKEKMTPSRVVAAYTELRSVRFNTEVADSWYSVENGKATAALTSHIADHSSIADFLYNLLPEDLQQEVLKPALSDHLRSINSGPYDG